MTRSEGPPVVARPAELAARIKGAPGLLLGLDFDGTLAPIVTDPDAATVDPEVVAPLNALSAAGDVSVAICSGRALGDLANRIPVDGPTLVGNHGLEVVRDGERQLAPAAEDARVGIARVHDHLTATLADVPGCRIEDKGPTLSVHVRETPTERIEEVRAAVETAVDGFGDLRLTTGKAVFEIRPAVDVDKGTAMERLAADVPADWLSVYVGDDTTDEDAFRAIQPGGAGIKVADGEADGDADEPRAPETAADYVLPDQPTVAPFLEWLVGRVSSAGAQPDGEVTKRIED